MGHPPIQAIGAAAVEPSMIRLDAAPVASRATPGTSFAHLLSSGIEQVNQKLIDADATVTAFALDDSVPIHQVTFALEEARLSFELAMQVRTRLLEAYQDLSKMQL